MLKVHRTEAKKLILSDDDRIYEPHEIKDILNMVEYGNRSKGQGQKTTGGLTRIRAAFGIAGFVRFQEGYYLVSEETANVTTLLLLELFKLQTDFTPPV